MFFLQLSTLEDSFSWQHIEAFDEYLSSLSPSAQKIITAHKLSLATKTNYAECIRFLKACIDLDLMYKRYALCCPECNGFLKIINSIEEVVGLESEYCSRCDETFQFDETNIASNIEIVFSLKDIKSPLEEGQQLNEPSLNIEGQAVAPILDLNRAIQFKIVGFNDLYAPTEAEYLILEQKLAEVIQPHETTVATGSSLEDFCAYLFGLCKIFRTTTKFRNSIHQIDTFVRITSYIPDGLFGIPCNYFPIECKNEKQTPKGEYLSKLHSTLHTMGGKLGIIISRMPAPNTYSQLAHDFYLKDDMCFVWFNLQELKALIMERGNLLETTNVKIMELKTNSNKTFSDMGLTNS